MKARKKMVLALIPALLLGSSGAYALGLGQIRVESALNEPLRAEIPVLSATPEELRGLSVSLASNEDFARANIKISRLQIPMEFRVEKRPSGTVITVTTEQAVGDPALDFLLEINWSKGKLLREYSVLLDPPGMAPAAAGRQVAHTAPARSAAAGRGQARRSRSTQSGAGMATASAAARVSKPVTIGQGSQYTVESGDSAWGIASRATSSDNINRMMLAIQQANPDAFYKDNINALKRGAVLRIPGRAELNKLSASGAKAEVARQNEIWSNPAVAAPSMLADNATGPVPRSTTASNSKDDSRLQLLPPGHSSDSGAGRSGVSGGSGQAAVAGLRQELARATESLKSQQQQSSELQVRVKDLENIKDKNKRLLSMKNAEIAELQQKLAEANNVAAASSTTVGQLRKDIFATPASTAAAASASVPSATSVASAMSAAQQPAAAPGTAGSVAEPAPSSTASTPANKANATPHPVEQQESVIEKPWYMRIWAWLLGALIILGLILAAVLRRRGKSGTDSQERLSNALINEDRDHDSVDESEDERALIDEIEQHQDDLSLHLELADLYYAHRNQDKFEVAAESMYTHVDDPQQPEWQQVRAMGEELCPDHPLFSGLHSDGHVVTDSKKSGKDEVPEQAGQAAKQDSSSQGYNFDFNLTSVGGADTTPETAPDEDNVTAHLHQDDLHEDLLSLSTLADQDSGNKDSASSDETQTDPAVGTDIIAMDDSSADDGGLAGDAADGVVDDEGFSSDPVDTKLDLARAYQDMGDNEGARAMLEEVIQEGNDAQQVVARGLLEELD